MAYYNLKTQISSGKFKGERVIDLIESVEGQNYLLSLHIGKFDVFLNSEVFVVMASFVRRKNIKHNTEDYEKDEYGNLLSGCCGCILDRETMICPLCKENC